MNWIDRLKVGDIVLFGNRKTPRVVLAISKPVIHKHSGRVFKRRYLTFTIQRCSWTTRPTTTYVSHELLKIAKPSKLKPQNMKKPVYKMLLADLHAEKTEDLNLRCHEVIGIP